MKLRRDKPKTSIMPEADAALEHSQQALYRILLRDPAVRSVVLDMIAMRSRNHFAEQITTLIAGRMDQ